MNDILNKHESAGSMTAQPTLDEERRRVERNDIPLPMICVMFIAFGWFSPHRDILDALFQAMNYFMAGAACSAWYGLRIQRESGTDSASTETRARSNRKGVTDART